MDDLDGAPNQTCILKVNVSCCKGCKVKVEKALMNTEGVYSICPNAQNGIVTVTGKAEPMTLVNVLAKIGKRAELLSYEDPPMTDKNHEEEEEDHYKNHYNFFKKKKHPGHGHGHDKSCGRDKKRVPRKEKVQDCRCDENNFNNDQSEKHEYKQHKHEHKHKHEHSGSRKDKDFDSRKEKDFESRKDKDFEGRKDFESRKDKDFDSRKDKDFESRKDKDFESRKDRDFGDHVCSDDYCNIHNRRFFVGNDCMPQQHGPQNYYWDDPLFQQSPYGDGLMMDHRQYGGYGYQGIRPTMYDRPLPPYDSYHHRMAPPSFGYPGPV